MNGLCWIPHHKQSKAKLSPLYPDVIGFMIRVWTRTFTTLWLHPACITTRIVIDCGKLVDKEIWGTNSSIYLENVFVRTHFGKIFLMYPSWHVCNALDSLVSKISSLSGRIRLPSRSCSGFIRVPNARDHHNKWTRCFVCRFRCAGTAMLYAVKMSI